MASGCWRTCHEIEPSYRLTKRCNTRAVVAVVAVVLLVAMPVEEQA
jgi:hypothetical protein